MKYCPECQANVEGLIDHCDCCGASLKLRERRFFTCGVYELPQCLGFSSLVYEMINALQPEDSEKYAAFLEEVGFRMICYPEWILVDGNIKNRLYYSSKKKCAGITITINYNDFISSDIKKKGCLIATSLLENLHLLQKRLYKDKLYIDDLVEKADVILGKYINDSVISEN